MSRPADADADAVPIADTEEIVVPAADGSGYAEGLVTADLDAGEPTLAVYPQDEGAEVVVEHDEAGLTLGATAELSLAQLRALRDELDAVVEAAGGDA